ncbi:MAG TPA: hypothetical protein VFL14_05810 [Xanthomonadales bacterium]|nr:hypothetical protein [Xanthomonadales bacterium]
MTSSTPAPAADWQPPRWLLTASRLTIGGATTLAALAVVLVLMAGLSGTRTGLGTIAGILAGTWIVTTAVHELGHWAAAALAGMTTIRLNVLWLAIERRRGGWTFALQEKPRLLDGYHVAYPDDRRSLRRQLAWHTLGGGLANLALALVAVAAIRLSTSPVQYVALFVLAAWNAAVSVASLLPSRSGAENDGYQLLRLWRAPMSRADEATLRIVGAFARGVVESELDGDDVAALAEGTPEQRVTGCTIAVVAALQREDLPAAVVHAATLEAAIDALPEPDDERRLFARTARLVGNAVDASMAEWLAAPDDGRNPWAAALRHAAHGRWPDCEAAFEPLLRVARQDFLPNTARTFEAIAHVVSRHARAATPADGIHPLVPLEAPAVS